jgi:hypothetical protein
MEFRNQRIIDILIVLAEVSGITAVYANRASAYTNGAGGKDTEPGGYGNAGDGRRTLTAGRFVDTQLPLSSNNSAPLPERVF